MNELYNVLTEHDEVLDGLEYSIIAVNLPTRQAVSLRDSGDAARRLTAEAGEAAEVPRFW
ncbi:hypothetical protein OJE16_17915 [Pantoea tagorei]|uniref:hypothetical protein n=1 Tax=Pantoea TaxID=53335 RepID=UPI000CDD1F45|nr:MULTISPECIES: hypothetical protein [Pantoea]MCG7368254.1 hypothetical protein [Pantoea sp. ACRSH]MCG7398649.1 hypothetical protein [Pantoea sp. ACRSC]POW53544.1 hypothetical protein C3408_23280 [Pantoea alvi]UBN52937.1 hypothetical protein LB453_13715 [Pantoea agglomerans]